MEPTPLPLRDIHLPEPIGWWPPAPGWWGLLVLLVLAALGVAFWRRRRRRGPTPLQAALAELSRLEADTALPARDKLQALSILMRRVVITMSPREEVAGLIGDDWLKTMDQIFTTNLFTKSAGRHLAESTYTKNVSAGLVAELILQVRSALHLLSEKSPPYVPQAPRIRLRR